MDIQKNINDKIDLWASGKLYESMTKHVAIEELQFFCENKSILIVGNSYEVTSQKHGERIDSYDIVVRMNHGINKPKLKCHMGSKCSIWGHGIGKYRLQIRDYDWIKRLTRYHIATNVYKLNPVINDGKCFIVDNNWYKTKYEQENRVEMSTGLNLVFLFATKIKVMNSLTIVGFDFLRTNNLVLSSVKTKFHNSTLEEDTTKEILFSFDKYIPFSKWYDFGDTVA